ncbi:MAG: hypothetical protein KDF64_18615 [Geminicoccaceae bacterium]|nr:hypothetical protein [Geminicoccaceae bacterium]
MRALGIGVGLVVCLVAGSTVAQGFGDDWRRQGLETPIGVDGGRMQEEAMPFLRDEQGRRIEVRAPYGTTLATSIGNLISVQAERGSTVMINTLQINRGNQQATVNLDGKSAETWLKNVEAVEPAAGSGN